MTKNEKKKFESITKKINKIMCEKKIRKRDIIILGLVLFLVLFFMNFRFYELIYRRIKAIEIRALIMNQEEFANEADYKLKENWMYENDYKLKENERYEKND